MNSNLSQQQLGSRLAALRKYFGMSQEELALKVKLSRPSLTQIELGNRSITALELKNFSMVLGFSLDHLLSTNFKIEDNFQKESKQTTQKNEIRISVPKLNIPKFKNVLLYLLEHCAGKPNVGETVLYKLLYFSDFNYYELYEEQFTGATYKKLPFGPVPQRLQSIINQMIEKGDLKRIKVEYHGYKQTRYLPLTKADLRELKASEKEVLDHVIDQFSDWSASAISDYSHQDIPWLVSKEGQIINYELAFYRERPYSVRNYEEERNEN